MKTLATLTAIGSAMFAVSTAQASSVSFKVQNNLPADTINNTYLSSCNTVFPTPGPVAPGTTSPSSGTNCGLSTSIVFDYTANGQTCRYALYSIFQPSTGTWMPNGGAASRGTVSAVCKISLTGASPGGNYGFTVTMQ